MRYGVTTDKFYWFVLLCLGGFALTKLPNALAQVAIPVQLWWICVVAGLVTAIAGAVGAVWQYFLFDSRGRSI